MNPFELPENKVVFTTTDGVGLKKGDEYWYVNKTRTNRYKLYKIAICSGQDIKKGLNQFHNQAIAREYLRLCGYIDYGISKKQADECIAHFISQFTPLS